MRNWRRSFGGRPRIFFLDGIEPGDTFESFRGNRGLVRNLEIAKLSPYVRPARRLLNAPRFVDLLTFA